jgi:NitT/TauT family transport system permease protein
MILVWQLLVQFQIVSPLLVASPAQLFPHLFSVFSLNTPFDVTSSFFLSIGLALEALCISMPLGLLIGLAIGRSKYVRNVLEEYVVALSALPKITLLPILVLFFGLGLTYRVGFAFLEATIYVSLVMMYAVMNVDQSLLKMAKAAGVSKRQEYFKVILPSTLPSILGALRFVFQITLGGVIIAEEFVNLGNNGIGFMIFTFTELFKLTYLYGVILAVVIYAASGSICLLALERYLLRWKSSSSSARRWR